MTADVGKETNDAERGGLRPWLFGIGDLVARHRCKEARHHRAPARAWSEPAAGGHESRVVARGAAERVRAQLAEALTKLSDGERDMPLPMVLRQLNHEEVGEAPRNSHGTAGSRLCRTRGKPRIAIN